MSSHKKRSQSTARIQPDVDSRKKLLVAVEDAVYSAAIGWQDEIIKQVVEEALFFARRDLSS